MITEKYVAGLVDELNNGRFVTMTDALDWCFRASTTLTRIAAERDDLKDRIHYTDGTADANIQRANEAEQALAAEKAGREVLEMSLAEETKLKQVYMDSWHSEKVAREKVEADYINAMAEAGMNKGLWQDATKQLRRMTEALEQIDRTLAVHDAFKDSWLHKLVRATLGGSNVE